jgi:murein DD-endopeptidase MepM/ murein hydrolase activator NlpD
VGSYQPVMRDYKPTPAKPQPRARWLLWFIAGLGLPLVTVAVMLPDADTPTNIAIVELPVEDTAAVVDIREAELTVQQPAMQASREISPYVAAPEAEPTGQRIKLTVGRGDSLDRLFRKNNLSSADLAMIMQQDLARKHLRLIKPGDEILVWQQNDQVSVLQREIDFSKSLKVSRIADRYDAGVIEHKILSQQKEARGRIKNSLFLSASDAGVSERTIMNLAGIFAWDIDFVLDIRTGDEFHVILEEKWHNGKLVDEGDILAAEFVNQGETFQAIRYKDPDGNVSYFTPDGRNMRKAFLRAPLSFSRISSNFNPNRRHPVLNTLRAHKGVDYAASSGTPVKAAGDGKVIFRGVKGGYGNVVIVQHGGNITTLYAHLSKFDRNAGNGSRVKQGQTIAYVGQSGLATGPHLHYEYRKNGAHMNPRTVSLPDAAPIDPNLRDDFERKAQPFIYALDENPDEISALTTARNN